MTSAWWGRERGPNLDPRVVASAGPSATQPELAPSSRRDASLEVRSRISSYTPEWTNLRTSDAGIALVRLFGEQIEPVLQRLNRLPNKAFVEFLDTAGIEPLPATPAEAMIEFEVGDGAPQSVLVAEGFQVGAKPATGSGDLVIFETERTLYAAPAKIAEMHTQESASFQEIDLSDTSEDAQFLPFGKKPIPGRALFIGLDGAVVPGPNISLGVRVAAPPGTPPPAQSGGLMPLPAEPSPMLRWEILDGTSYQPAEVVIDETGGFFHSGVIELKVPSRWRTGRPGGLEGDAQLRWLRLRIVHGQYSESPALSFIKLNVVRAIAARSVFDEIPETVAGTGGRRMRLSQIPVLPGSLTLEVDEGGAPLDSSAGAGDETGDDTTWRRWKEVDDLASWGPDDRVYVLDPASGEISFGDNVNGASVPQGFRNVRAASYQVGGGSAGAAAAEAISTLISSAPFIKSAKNPIAASGGTDTETNDEALRRGPQEIRARGRAVTVADYALMAQRASGAQVERAYAVSGFHPSYPGSPIPGVVGVFIVPPDRGEGAPTPDEEALRAAADYLSAQLAPAGVDVVVAAPRYQKIRAEATIIIGDDADAGEVVRDVLARLDEYFHPLTGGDDGRGWPFGGPLRYTVILRQITNVAGVRAVPRFSLILDGLRIPACTDYLLAAYALLWPDSHEVIVADSEVTS